MALHIEPNSPWTLRRARAADATAIARHRYPDALHDPRDLQAYGAWLGPKIADSGYVGWLATTRQGATVAGAGAVLLDWGPIAGISSALRARVCNVFVDSVWRRRGLATAVLAELLHTLSEAGVEQYSLSAPRELRPLYASLGFAGKDNEMVLWAQPAPTQRKP